MKDLKISLAAARVNAKLTQEDVANKIKVSKATVNNWENGRTSPSFSDLNTLSKLYRIPIDNIFLPTSAT